MATHRSAVGVWVVCALATAASSILVGSAFSADAQERPRPQKNIGQQQREDSLKADQARKSGEMSTQPSASPNTSAGLAVNATNPIQGVQEALKKDGYDPGPIDGMMGRRTQDALRAYQTAQHLKVTGRIDQATLDKLGIRPSGRNP